MTVQQAGGEDSRSLWSNPPDDRESGRRLLTRERVVAEALGMRAIAAHRSARPNPQRGGGCCRR